MDFRAACPLIASLYAFTIRDLVIGRAFFNSSTNNSCLTSLVPMHARALRQQAVLLKSSGFCCNSSLNASGVAGRTFASRKTAGNCQGSPRNCKQRSH